MRKILVTAIGGDVGNGILKILSKTSDEIYGCDINEYPVGMDKVKVFWKSDLAISHGYIRNLLDKCLYYKITHLIPVNEAEIKVISENRSLFIENNIKLIIQEKNVIDICLDKLKTIQYFNKYINKNLPKTFTFDDFEFNGAEYIVKLRNSCGSKYIKHIKDKNDLNNIPYSKEEYIIQEYLDDDDEEYTVGVFSDGNVINSILFKRKLKHGYSSFVELVQNKDLQNLSEEIADNLNLRGYINIQLRKDKEMYKIFEINPRISGTVYFRHLLGFDDLLWWLDFIDNKKIPSYSNTYKKAIGMRELSEKFVLLEK